VTQGIIVLAVVIAYEVVRRYRTRLEQSHVAEQVAAPKTEEATA
jgi:simple sugar transport system permease protein